MSAITDKILLQDIFKEELYEAMYPEFNEDMKDILLCINEDGTCDEDRGLLFPCEIKDVDIYDK